MCYSCTLVDDRDNLPTLVVFGVCIPTLVGEGDSRPILDEKVCLLRFNREADWCSTPEGDKVGKPRLGVGKACCSGLSVNEFSEEGSTTLYGTISGDGNYWSAQLANESCSSLLFSDVTSSIHVFEVVSFSLILAACLNLKTQLLCLLIAFDF